jgi:hypothetical protein
VQYVALIVRSPPPTSVPVSSLTYMPRAENWQPLLRRRDEAASEESYLLSRRAASTIQRRNASCEKQLELSGRRVLALPYICYVNSFGGIDVTNIPGSFVPLILSVRKNLGVRVLGLLKLADVYFRNVPFSGHSGRGELGWSR